tara:strand:- start:145 stop:702 length:558 start_codon:yes stop_codon:yes gene_type:complete
MKDKDSIKEYMMDSRTEVEMLDNVEKYKALEYKNIQRLTELIKRLGKDVKIVLNEPEEVTGDMKKADADYLLLIDNKGYYVEVKHFNGQGNPIKCSNIKSYEDKRGNVLLLYVKNYDDPEKEKFALINTKDIPRKNVVQASGLGNKFAYFFQVDEWFKFDKVKKDLRDLNKFQTKLNKELGRYYE